MPTQTSGLIITADDFGVNDSVNRGTLAGVRKGIVSSVHVMANLVTREAIEELQDTISECGNKCGIGLHLNTTWGKAMIQQAASFKHTWDLDNDNPTDDLFTYRGLNTYEHKQTNFAEMRAELFQQYDTLAGYLGGAEHIDAISSHHNIHFWDKKFLDIIHDIAAEHKIPVRSPLRMDTNHQQPEAHEYPHGTGPLKRAALKNLKGISAGTFKLLSAAICAEKLHEYYMILTNGYQLPAPKNNSGHWFGQPGWEPVEWLMLELDRLQHLEPRYTTEIFMHLADSPSGGDHRWDYDMPKRFSEFAVINTTDFAQKFNGLKEELGTRHGSYKNVLVN